MPARLWLERYAELFDTVEINCTFYGTPKPKSVATWVEQTPPGFLFTVKASRYLTHIKRLADSPEKNFKLHRGHQALLRAARAAARGGPLGPDPLAAPRQLPPRRRAPRADALAAAARPARFRVPPSELVHRPRLPAALGDHDAALVIADDPERPFTTREITASWTFLRLHRGSHGRRGNYSDAELATWRRRIAAWRSRVDVLAYLNNDWEAFAAAQRDDPLRPQARVRLAADATRRTLATTIAPLARRNRSTWAPTRPGSSSPTSTAGGSRPSTASRASPASAGGSRRPASSPPTRSTGARRRRRLPARPPSALGAAATTAFATSAVRDASNGDAFLAELRERFSLSARVLDGLEEARLTYRGARQRPGGRRATRSSSTSAAARPS